MPPASGDVAGYVAELTGRFSTQQSGRGVNLLTFHRSKGLEWDAVFLPRLLDKELPFRTPRSSADPDEERRLFYVGITRARQHLYLSWPQEARTAPEPVPGGDRGRQAGTARREARRDERRYR